MSQIMRTRSARTVPDDPRAVRGVVRLTARELRTQRRLTLAFTVGPLLGVGLAIWMLWGSGISALDLALLLSFYAFTGLGITVGFHRLFTHRSFRATAPARIALAVAGSLRCLDCRESNAPLRHNGRAQASKRSEVRKLFRRSPRV